MIGSPSTKASTLKGCSNQLILNKNKFSTKTVDNSVDNAFKAAQKCRVA